MWPVETSYSAQEAQVATRPAPFRVEPISGALGAELLGIDIARGLDDVTIAAIRHALLDHGVVFFRDQVLDVPRHKAFAAQFGELFVHPNIGGSKADPAVIDVIRKPGDKHIIGEDWHSDTTHVARPPMGSVLYGVDVPPFGGDTMFANQYLAYDTLSLGMKVMFDGVRVLRSDRRLAGPGRDFGAANAAKVTANDAWRETAHYHPLFRTHPETGRKALYIGRGTAIRFEHMTEDESRPLIDYLCAHATRPEFTCRFRWQKDSVAFWDNRSTQHIAVNDTGEFSRVMRRVQILGDDPF